MRRQGTLERLRYWCRAGVGLSAPAPLAGSAGARPPPAPRRVLDGALLAVNVVPRGDVCVEQVFGVIMLR